MVTLPLIDEKNSGARNGGESVSHFADFCVIDEASEEEKEPCGAKVSKDF